MFWALFWRRVTFGMLVFNIKVHFMNSWKIMWNVLLHIISSWLSPLHWTQFQVLYKKYFGRQVSNHVSLGSKIFGQISMVCLSQPGVPTSQYPSVPGVPTSHCCSSICRNRGSHYHHWDLDCQSKRRGIESLGLDLSPFFMHFKLSGFVICLRFSR